MSAATRAARQAGQWSVAFGIALRTVGILVAILVVVQSLIVVEARPQDLITGFHGMVDIISPRHAAGLLQAAGCRLAGAGDGRHRTVRHHGRRHAWRCRWRCWRRPT